MLPKLYSLRSDSKLQEWSVEVDGNKYRFFSGIVDGKITCSEWTTCKGKNVGRANETTPAQQAESEARSHWQKKCDKGYKVDPKDVNDVGFFKPMLAGKYDPNKPPSFPVYIQPKLDGMRCIVTASGMFKRTGKPVVSAPHVMQALEPLFDENPDLIFDGELYADKFADDFGALMSLATQDKPTAEDLRKSEEHLQYHVYDLPSEQTTFDKRSSSLANLLDGLASDKIVFVQTVLVNDQKLLDDLYGAWIEQGYEGQMIRLNALYENKRTNSLLKRKEFVDDEYTILDVLEGEGNRSGMAGKMLFKTAANKEFRANIKGNRELYREILRDKKKYVGQIATVKYFHLTPDGVPRFPVVIKFDK